MRFRLIEYLNESKADQQRFIDKFGQDTFNKFLKIKEKIQPKDEFISDITGEVVERPKDITYLMSVDKEVVDEMISFYNIKGQKDIENRPIPVPPNTKRLMYNKDGYKIYLVTNYEDMIDISSLRYGSEIGRWCIAGRYATDSFTDNDVYNGQVKVSQAKQYFNQYIPNSPDGYYVVITPEGKKFCILVGNNEHQIWNCDDSQISDTEFIEETSVEIGKVLGIHDWRIEAYEWDGSSTIPQGAINVRVKDGVTVVDDGENSNIKQVQLPETVSVIDVCAFIHCRELTNINLPDSLKKIGGKAFYNCYSLKYINLPSGLEEISRGAFAYSGINSIVIPASVKTIGRACFFSSDVIEVVFDDGVEADIPQQCFAFCDNLTKVYIPDSIRYISPDAFEYCNLLKDLTLPKRFESMIEDFLLPTNLTKENIHFI